MVMAHFHPFFMDTSRHMKDTVFLHTEYFKFSVDGTFYYPAHLTFYFRKKKNSYPYYAKKEHYRIVKETPRMKLIISFDKHISNNSHNDG